MTDPVIKPLRSWQNSPRRAARKREQRANRKEWREEHRHR